MMIGSMMTVKIGKDKTDISTLWSFLSNYKAYQITK